MKPRHPDEAPGYKCKPNRNGTYREGWEARHDLARRGYKPVWVRLHYSDTPDGKRQLAARCTDLQGQMLAWAASDVKPPSAAMTARSRASRGASRLTRKARPISA